MTKLNIETWENMYASSRSLLEYPDETVVQFLNKNKESLEGKKGIDIGCGAGRHTFLMHSLGMYVYGIDSSKSAIEFARKKKQDLGLDCRIEFDNIQVQDLVTEKETYDLIIIWGVLHYLKESDRISLFNQLYDMLKVGGKILCTLRSNDDSRCDETKKVGENRYQVDYFDLSTTSPKQTILSFWNYEEVVKMFEKYSELTLGHRRMEKMGEIGTKSSHWLIGAIK